MGILTRSGAHGRKNGRAINPPPARARINKNQVEKK